jgi:hypothetical protein
MKKLFLFTFCFVLFFSSCTSDDTLILKNEQKSSSINSFNNYNFKTELVVGQKDERKMLDVFKITADELSTYLHHCKVLDKTKETIEPITFKGATVMYVVSTGKGWKLCSTDKRMPVVLAENNTGEKFSIKKFLHNEEISEWFNNLEEEILSLKKSTDYKLYSNNIKQWAGLDKDIELKVMSDDDTGSDEWTLVGFDNWQTSDENHSHLLTTLWHQETPFNSCMPYISSTSTQRCPCGCTPVAVAQFLFYMHNKIGIPQTTPGIGYFTGYVGNYFQSFDLFNSNNFSQMALTDNSSIYNSQQFFLTSLMIAYVGKQLGTTYNATQSSTHLNNVVPYLSNIGINATCSDFSLNSTVTSLSNQYPVLLSAKDNNSNSHTWLADGYVKETISCDEIYANMNDSVYKTNGNVIPDGTPIQRRRVVTSINYKLYMNWGFNDVYDFLSDSDDTAYFVSDNWRNLNYRKKMIIYNHTSY